MRQWVYGAVLGLIAAVLAGEVYLWLQTGPSSYDECIVSEMRGQSAQVLFAVQKVCAVRFRKEDELPLSWLDEKIKFSILPDFDKDPGVVLMGSKNFDKPPKIVTVLKNETDYEITRLRLKHSFAFEVDCSVVPEDEWRDGPEFTFTAGVANVAMPAVYDEKTKLYRPPLCYQFAKIWGAPRKQ